MKNISLIVRCRPYPQEGWGLTKSWIGKNGYDRKNVPAYTKILLDTGKTYHEYFEDGVYRGKAESR